LQVKVKQELLKVAWALRCGYGRMLDAGCNCNWGKSVDLR
jgi:hypothetical protein